MNITKEVKIDGFFKKKHKFVRVVCTAESFFLFWSCFRFYDSVPVAGELRWKLDCTGK